MVPHLAVLRGTSHASPIHPAPTHTHTHHASHRHRIDAEVITNNDVNNDVNNDANNHVNNDGNNQVDNDVSNNMKISKAAIFIMIRKYNSYCLML